jgi:hypothetical protein
METWNNQYNQFDVSTAVGSGADVMDAHPLCTALGLNIALSGFEY